MWLVKYIKLGLFLPAESLHFINHKKDKKEEEKHDR